MKEIKLSEIQGLMGEKKKCSSGWDLGALDPEDRGVEIGECAGFNSAHDTLGEKKVGLDKYKIVDVLIGSTSLVHKTIRMGDVYDIAQMLSDRANECIVAVKEGE